MSRTDRMIVLAAGTGTRLHPLTADRPKCLVPVGGKPILEHILAAAAVVGIRDVVLVGGYRAERLDGYGARVAINPDYGSSNMVESLFCVEEAFGTGFVLSYGDILYEASVLERCCASRAPVSVVVDEGWRSYWQERFADPLSDAESLRIDAAARISDIGRKVERIEEIQAQYVGLLAFRDEGVRWLREARTALGRAARTAYMTDLLRKMIELGHPLSPVVISGGWAEVDRVEDIGLAERRLGLRP